MLRREIWGLSKARVLPLPPVSEQHMEINCGNASNTVDGHGLKEISQSSEHLTNMTV